MTDTRLEVTGLRELHRGVTDAMVRFDRLLHTTTIRGVEADILPAVQRRTPKRTGRLAASERVVHAQPVRLEAGSVTVLYAAVIHDGSPRRGIAPNPYMDRGITDAEDTLMTRYQHMLDDLYRRAFPQ